jgi:hypothetical protein
MPKIQGFQVAGKAWVALFGSLLTFFVPLAVQYSASLPAPWPSLIGVVVALLTAVGVYHAPYQPVAPRNSAGPSSPTSSSNPWPTS